MNNLKKLTNLNLVWIGNKDYWLHRCQTCGKIELERRKTC